MGYIDTSVLVAYYCPEALSEKAQNTIRGSPPTGSVGSSPLCARSTPSTLP